MNDMVHLNLAVVRGQLSSPAATRVLPSGDRLVSLEVSVRGPERVDTVPVAWVGAPGYAGSLDAGETVLVVGHVRRRFFRAGSATQSRTEVVAHTVVPGPRAKRAASALKKAADELEVAAGS